MPRRFLFSLVALSLLPAVRAQDDVEGIQRPLLWEFQQADSDVVSYLFGTIHVSDPRITKLHPAIRTAFDSAQSVWFEIDFAKDAGVQAKAITLPKGQHLRDLVSAETLQRIDARVAKLSPRLSRTTLPEFRVIMWPIALGNIEAQIKHPNARPMDMQLQAEALMARKKTGGLEDASRQLKPLTDLPIQQQLEFLEASLDVMEEDDALGVSQLDNLVRLYVDGDGDALHEYLRREMQRPGISDDLKELFVETLLIQRNRQMVEAIMANVKAAPNDVQFVAVGAAHLVGEGSMVDVLRESGFTVRRIPAADPTADSRPSDDEQTPAEEASATLEDAGAK